MATKMAPDDVSSYVREVVHELAILAAQNGDIELGDLLLEALGRGREQMPPLSAPVLGEHARD